MVAAPVGSVDHVDIISREHWGSRSIRRYCQLRKGDWPIDTTTKNIDSVFQSVYVLVFMEGGRVLQELTKQNVYFGCPEYTSSTMTPPVETTIPS